MKIKLFIATGLTLAVVLAGLAGCSAARVAAADTQPVNVHLNEQSGINVNGEGRVSVAPDIAILSLGISAQAAKVADAQSQASAAMNKVMAALTAAGLDKKDIQTQSYNITQVVKYDKSAYIGSGVVLPPVVTPVPVLPPAPDAAPNQAVGTSARGAATGAVAITTPPPSVNEYQVNNMVTVKVRAIDKTGDIVDAVAAAGGDLTRVNSVSFSIDQPEKYYAQARTAAMNDAKAKATSLASLAGVTLGSATFVSENSYPQTYNYGGVYYRSSMAAGGAVPATSFSAGQSDIVIDVQVNYAIQ